MQQMKIRVNNPVHSKEIQRILFDMGYGWAIREKCFQHTEESGLTTWADGSICYTDDMGHFYNGVDNPEYTLKDGKLVPVEDIAQQESIEKDYIELTVKVMKKDIPDWATHITVDHSGIWFFDDMPMLHSRSYCDYGDKSEKLPLSFVEPACTELPVRTIITLSSMLDKYDEGAITREELLTFIEEN